MGSSKRDKDLVVADGKVAREDVGYLRKAADAIAIKPHAGKLTLLTRKINNILMAEAQDQGIQQSTYRISLSKLCGKANYDSRNTELIKDQLRRMAATTVEWQIGVKGNRRWGITNLCNVEIIEKGQRCDLEWDYPQKLKEKLLAPDVYVRLALEMQNSFRSNAAFALYEICARYAGSPGQVTMRMPWTEWRPTLTGVPDADEENVAYSEYKYFKRRVIKPAIEEVNQLTPLQVELIEHKQGRAVADLQFRVQSKAQSDLALDAPNLLDMSLIERMEALGFTAKQAENLYSDADEGNIRAALDYTEQRIKFGVSIDNPAGYFRNALTKGYGQPAEDTKQLCAPAQQRKAMPAKEGGASLADQLLAAWRAEKRQAARAAFDAKPPAEQLVQLKTFSDSEKLPAAIATMWRDQGLASRICSEMFTDWLTRDLEPPDTMALLQFGIDRSLIPVLGA